MKRGGIFVSHARGHFACARCQGSQHPPEIPAICEFFVQRHVKLDGISADFWRSLKRERCRWSIAPRRKDTIVSTRSIIPAVLIYLALMAALGAGALAAARADISRQDASVCAVASWDAGQYRCER